MSESVDKRILPIDSQILDAIQKCPFFCYLNFIQNYRTRGTIAPMERGDLGHTVLETYYKLIQRGFSWDDAVEQATIVGREHYQSLEIDLATCEWVIKTFHQYAEYYKYDGIEVLGVEETFSFVIYEDDELVVVYEGKIDLHAKFPALGISLMDHKFRAMKVDYNPLDNQFIGYSVAAKASLIYVNEVGLQKSYTPDVKFRRVPVAIGNGVKERWLKNTIVWAKILDFNIQNNMWPQSHLKTAPTGVTQCVKCNYNRICDSENEQEMERKVQDHFKLGTKWSPHTIGQTEEVEK